MAIRITCITKDDTDNQNRYTAISELGWINESTQETGRSSRLTIYDFIKNGGTAYVKDFSGNLAYLMTAETFKGTKYVKTVADETKTDNLLSLGRC